MPQRTATENALSDYEFRQLKRAAREGVKKDFRLRCEFILLTAGELGLRPSEISHMSEEWIDWETSEINIPEYDSCESGKNGDFCGYCKLRARKAAEHNDDVTYEMALRERWKPKDPASARTIYFGWSDELLDLFDRFFLEYDSYPDSRTSINRRIDRIVDAAPRIENKEINPQSLRGRTALFHAKEGMGAYHLMQFMGWTQLKPAMEYVEVVASDLKTELKRVHG